MAYHFCVEKVFKFLKFSNKIIKQTKRILLQAWTTCDDDNGPFITIMIEFARKRNLPKEKKKRQKKNSRENVLHINTLCTLKRSERRNFPGNKFFWSNPLPFYIHRAMSVLCCFSHSFVRSNAHILLTQLMCFCFVRFGDEKCFDFFSIFITQNFDQFLN